MAAVLNDTRFYVYVLRSQRDGKLYTGVTSDLDRRIREHNAGKTKSLRGRRPLVLAYWEQHPTKAQALVRERYFKTPEGGLVKQALVAQARRGGRAAYGGGLEIRCPSSQRVPASPVSYLDFTLYIPVCAA